MNAIRPLPDAVINKIKAGEMIERPANVLKELLENAIDAGAKRITVALQRGGIDEIVVSDDGDGIAADDVPIAIKRHTTSKISSSDDLWALHSLGFRGEALASIAEVSRFMLTTATASAKAGTRLTRDDENVDIVPWDCRQGTRVSVAEIFYNVPARRKFLKNVATEYAHCNTCVQALALSHPHITFILHHNNREQLHAPAVKDNRGVEHALRMRAATLFGEEAVAPLLYEEGKNKIAAVEMLFSPPGHDRAHNRHIFTFVNNRWVQSNTLKYAILRGYHSHLLKGRYPLLFAQLQVHPTLLDVNVHPMKREVRFQYEREVQELIALTLRRKLRSPEWSIAPPNTSAAAASAPRPPVNTRSYKADTARIFFPSSSVAPMQGTELASKVPKLDTGSTYGKPQLEVGEVPPANTQEPATVPSASSELENKQPTTSHPTELQQTSLNWEELTHIGTFAHCYLLFEDRQRNLVVVDQHAFHERIIFEQLAATPQLLTRRQQLGIAETLALPAEDLELLTARQEEFARLGFVLELVSDAAVQIKAVPALLQAQSGSELLALLLDLARRDATLWIGESLVHDVLATLACRAAVKAGDILEPARLQRLFAAAQTVDFYHNCPHGRRVIRIFSLRQAGSWFDRI